MPHLNNDLIVDINLTLPTGHPMDDLSIAFDPPYFTTTLYFL
jgi:hypothetical protein